MSGHARKPALRCAIYTRVSTDVGLEQDFNSLDNQREASEAYIKSQAHEGWKLVRDRFDDGGFSGGSMERPALQKLLGEVRARRVDVIVVYKVDRLTRSLADFAKLVELFDAHGVSFISVTQAFNTTTSMGRLTLNMLLSFAQFEREITGERIRDKIAASKRKGIWMGGPVPLGYRVENRALHILESEAEFVRSLFRRYLELGSVVRLMAVLDAENVRSPVRASAAGRTSGGTPLSRGHLYWLLANPIYAGRLSHKGRIHDGLHESIVDVTTWDQVQQRLASQTKSTRTPQPDEQSFLAGKLFDDRGNRMGASYTARSGRRWRYYVSRAVLTGRKQDAGSVVRIPAPEIESRVVDAVRTQLASHLSSTAAGRHHRPDAILVKAERDVSSSEPEKLQAWGEEVLDLLERVTIGKAGIAVELREEGLADGQDRNFTIPWTPRPSRRRREIIRGHENSPRATRAMRSKARESFAHAIRNAHRWLGELTRDPETSVGLIALREDKSERSIRMTLSLAFLSPDLAKAAIEGDLPRGFGVQRLADLPMLWSEQWRAVGLQPPPRTATNAR